MASLPFTWTDAWNYYEQADNEIKQALEQEVIGEGWLFAQTEKTQTEVLRDAPKAFLKSVASRLRPETCLKLKINPYY